MNQSKKINFRSYLSHPAKQIKYSFLVGVVLGSISFITNYYLYWKLTTFKWENDIDNNSLVKVMIKFNESIVENTMITFILSFGFSFVLMIVITHRFVGPFVAIKRFILANLNNENPKALKIRQTDEMHEIVELINLLAEKKSKE